MIICKQCKVKVEDYNHDSHFRCPSCHKTLFQDTGEGGLEIEEADDVCFLCSNGNEDDEYLCDDCRKMIRQLAIAFRIVINEN